MHRCAWAESDPVMREYHDLEWGVPQFDRRQLWEMLVLEGFQAGLSWITILKRREGFRDAFDNFDPEKISRYKERDVDRLMTNEKIIRARAKIEATIGNARAYLQMQEEGLDFSNYVWKAAGGKPILNGGNEVIAQSPLSMTFSKDFKKKGFKFVGPVIVYAWMQAVGIVNDHDARCFRRAECIKLGKL